MKLKTFTIAVVSLAMGASIAFAAGDLKEQRESMMKKNGAAMGALAKIAKGQQPYDAEVVKAALKDIHQVGRDFPDLFPSADAVVDPEASPKIWTNMDDFKKISKKMAQDAKGLMEAVPADQAAVGAAMGTLGASCQACHESYRIKL